MPPLAFCDLLPGRWVLAASRSWNRKLFTHVRISTVRQTWPMQRAGKLMLAFLVFLGAVAPAFANRTCAPAVARCQAMSVSHDADGCCPCHDTDHKSQAPRSRDCCTICPSFNSLAAHVATAIVLPPFEIAALPTAIENPTASKIRMSARIPLLADNSPPEFVHVANFGRAPPVA